MMPSLNNKSKCVVLYKLTYLNLISNIRIIIFIVIVFIKRIVSSLLAVSNDVQYTNMN